MLTAASSAAAKKREDRMVKPDNLAAGPVTEIGTIPSPLFKISVANGRPVKALRSTLYAG